MYRERFDNIIIVCLVCFTIILVALHNLSLNRHLVIDNNSPYFVDVITDKEGNNGLSTASLEVNDDHFLLECHIIKSNYAWPFCEITIFFIKGKNNEIYTPLDLSLYSSVKVSAKYIGKKSPGIRFQLRSFNNAYSTTDNQASWKYNGIEFFPSKNLYPVTIPMKSLQVSTWWLIEEEIPIEYSSPEFGQVMVLEIATGNNTQPGHYQLRFEKVEFIGKYFSNTQVYGFIIFIWSFTALVGFFINIQRSRIKLRKAVNRTKELKQLNRLLNVESKALKDQAERDPLTGALNRSGVEAIFTNEIKVISLMFIDIDHFKPINDNHGHAIGDEILKAFVKLISENCRATDFLCRWGGEEFLLICPNTPLPEATDLAESLRVMIKSHCWVNQISLTASFGVAQKGQETTSDFIERADQALYNAKAQGRNKVIVSKGPNIDSSISF